MAINKLMLLSGYPIPIDNVGSIHQLKLKQIVDMSEKKYNDYISLVAFDLQEIDLDIDELPPGTTSFEIIRENCIYNESIREITLEALTILFDECVKFDAEGGFFYLGLKHEKRIMDNDNYSVVRNVIRQINCLSEPEPYVPGNDLAKEFIKELREKKKKYANLDKSYDLASIISGTVGKSHNVNILNVWDLTIYQLYDAFYRLELIDQYDKTLTGIYAGTINAEKTDLKKLCWYKKIN